VVAWEAADAVHEHLLWRRVLPAISVVLRPLGWFSAATPSSYTTTAPGQKVSSAASTKVLSAAIALRVWRQRVSGSSLAQRRVYIAILIMLLRRILKIVLPRSYVRAC
jgi:hypothetical protein